MGREATGNVYESNGKWYARISLGAGARPNIALAAGVTEKQARARMKLLVGWAGRLRDAHQPTDVIRNVLERAATEQGEALERLRGVVDGMCKGSYVAAGRTRRDAGLTTVRDLGERWTKGELHRDHPDHVRAKRTANFDAWRFEKHIYPFVGDVCVTAFTVDHADAVMASLPKKLSSATRRHVAQLMHRLLSMAVFPLRLIAANPIPPGYLPGPGSRKALSYLYPDEDRLLLARIKVPLALRVLYGFLAREGLRSSEAAGLTWADVDLARGAIALDVNKTDDPRSWALAPGTVAALSAWKEIERGKAKGLVFAGVSFDHLAKRFRELDLKEAGVTRAELFERAERVTKADPRA